MLESLPHAAADDREERLNALLLEFAQAREAGRPLNRAAFVAAHPEFAAELAEFIDLHQRVEQVAGPLRQAEQPRGSEDDAALRRAILVGDASPSESSASRASAASRESDGLSEASPPRGRAGAGGAPRGLGRLGDFRLLREMGRGGMGVVYEATQLSLNRRVALKVLPFAAALDERQLQRFKNEAQAAALLHHPNIVPVYAVGCERGVHYYAMQFIAGQSLAALLEELRQRERPAAARADDDPQANVLLANDSAPVGAEAPANSVAAGDSAAGAPLSDTARAAADISTERGGKRVDYYRRVAKWGAQAAWALDHAHQVGVVHRDIKPANLLLDGRGALWVTDFGLAQLQSDAGLTRTGEIIGTLRYMSPEQAGAQHALVDHRADVYSLGATLYELFTLEPLFAGHDRQQLLTQITTQEPRSPRAAARDLPRELETILLKALAKNPAERYVSAGEFAADLERFLRDEPIRARRPTVLDRATKWARRHRNWAAAGLVLLLLATAVLLVSTVLIAQAHRAARQAYASQQQKSRELDIERRRAEANFRQARRAVDFFTEVSAEELGNKYSAPEARRKMLEGALDYYQEFIDQQADASQTRAELAASRARVAQLLDDLNAQGDYFRCSLLTHLLGDPAIRRDLGLSGEQETALAEALVPLNEERKDAFWRVHRLPREEQPKRFRELASAVEQTLAGALTTPQGQRLRQLAWQRLGHLAILEPEVAQRLALSSDQRRRLRELQDESRRRQWFGGPSHARDRERDRARARELTRQTEEQSLAVLTESQRAALTELLGEPFQGEFPPLTFGFGPERGPGERVSLERGQVERGGPTRSPPPKRGDPRDAGPPGFQPPGSSGEEAPSPGP